jgi:hypothetical protein
LTTPTPAAIPVAWLKPIPPGYRLPVWRWILLPASALMLKLYRGVWISGQLELHEESLRFVQTSALPIKRRPAEHWTLALKDIRELDLRPGFGTETIELHHAGGVAKLMSARSEAFVARIRAALAQRQAG